MEQQHHESNNDTLDKQHALPPERVSDTQEDYRRALIGVIKEVMNPPDFTGKNRDGISQRTSRYAWCIQINKLLRNLKSVTSRLAPIDVPPSFEDVDAFVRDAWQFAFTDEVPNFYVKWPKDLDKRVEEAFQNEGEPLGKMMREVPNSVELESETGLAGRGYGCTADSAAKGHASGPAVPSGGAFSPSPPRNSIPIASPFTPQTTPSLDPHIYNTSSQQSTSASPQPKTPSPSRRFGVSDSEGLMKGRDKDGQPSRVGKMRGRQKHAPRRTTFSSSPSLKRIQQNLETLPPTFPPPESCPPPPSSETPAPEATPAEEGRSTSSPNRYSSERPWVPQSYRDGSMPADLRGLYSQINDICEEADTLIVQAADIDARDEREMRLRDWTSRARKCEESGRKVLIQICASFKRLAKSSEVLWATSTLKLLKSAHVELVEYADEMLKSSRANTPAMVYSGPRTRTALANARQARRKATSNLRPPIRRWTESTGPSESRETPTDAAERSLTSREADQPSEVSGPSCPSERRKLVPWVEIPSVPWKWYPERPRRPTPEPAPAAEPKTRIITKSIVIRSRQLNNFDNNAGAAASSSSAGNPPAFREVKLQRISDQGADDEQLFPPCTECGTRGFSCFGQNGKEGACRRCKRVRKGHCTYARHMGRVAGVSTSSTRTKIKEGKSAGGKGKGKGKEVMRPNSTENESLASTSRVKGRGAEKGYKWSRPKRGSGTLRKLKEERERMKRDRRRRIASGESEEESESEEEGSSADEDSGNESEFDAGTRPLKRMRRIPSPQATYDDLYLDINMAHADVPARATSEPPEHRDISMRRSRSRRPELRLASLVRAQTSTTERNSGSAVASEPLRGTSGSGSGGMDSQSTMKSVGPEVEPMIEAVRESPDNRVRNEDVRMESQDAPPSNMDVEYEHLDPEHASTIAALMSLASDTHITPSAPPPITVATGGISVLTPTSITSSSPPGTQTLLPSVPLSFTSASLALQSHPDLQRQSQQQQQQQHENRTASLKAKLDALMAAHAQLSTEMQAKVDQLAGEIKNVSEELKVLESSRPSASASTEER